MERGGEARRGGEDGDVEKMCGRVGDKIILFRTT